MLPTSVSCIYYIRLLWEWVMLRLLWQTVTLSVREHQTVDLQTSSDIISELINILLSVDSI